MIIISRYHIFSRVFLPLIHTPDSFALDPAVVIDDEEVMEISTSVTHKRAIFGQILPLRAQSAPPRGRGDLNEYVISNERQ